ncbi:helix-turn-helix domain-containing protein [Rhodococcus erythropolis]
MGQLEWQAETVRRVAETVNKLRGNRSAQWLSDQTAELGFRVARSTISDLETGRRTRLDIAELLVIAAALNVPPVMLLYPKIPDGEVQVTPGISMKSIDAARWFGGETILDGIGDAGQPQLRTSGGLDLMRLARERSNAGASPENAAGG